MVSTSLLQGAFEYNNLFPECEEYGKGSMGTIIVGDLNVHHKPWLQFYNGISPEGHTLFETCCVQGFQQCVRKSTHGKYLLDLVLTNVEELVTSKVQPTISDHNCSIEYNSDEGFRNRSREKRSMEIR